MYTPTQTLWILQLKVCKNCKFLLFRNAFKLNYIHKELFLFWLKTCVSSSSRAKKALNETLNYQFLCTLYGFEPPFFPRTFCKKIYFLNVIRIVVFVTLSFRCCTMLLYLWVNIDGLDGYITFVYHDIWLSITKYRTDMI